MVGPTELLLVLVFIAVPAAIIAAFVAINKRSKETQSMLELALAEIVRSVPADKQTAFMVQYESGKKSTSTAVLLTLLLGCFGAHKFYLGKTGMGILYLVFCWTYIPAIVAFFEAFAMPTRVRQYNTNLAQRAAALLNGQFIPSL